MERKQIEAVALNYPPQYVQGLYAIPIGIGWFMTGLTNLISQPTASWILVGGLLLCLGAWLGITRYYQNNFGRATPTKSRRIRYGLAIFTSFVVFIGADQLTRIMFGRPPDRPMSSYAASWSLGMLVFFGMTIGVKMHHIVIWGSLFVIGVLPIWGLNANRDAIAAFPIGVAIILSGLMDHRLLVRASNVTRNLTLENNNDEA